MTTFNFGTAYDPAHYVEIPDPDNAGQVIRPDAGVTLKARNAKTLAALPDITTTTYGYWATSTTDVPQIQVSGDGGSTWVGPLDAAEARTSAITAGVDASSALSAANGAVTTAGTALTTAQQALAAAQAGGGGGTFTGSVDYGTQVTGKPSIPSTAADLGAIATSAKGAANGVASLDATTKVPLGQLPVGTDGNSVAAGNHTHVWGYAQMPPGSVGTVDYNTTTGSWPQRPTSRTDIVIIWRAPAGVTPAPSGGGYAVDGMDEFKIKAS